MLEGIAAVMLEILRLQQRRARNHQEAILVPGVSTNNKLCSMAKRLASSSCLRRNRHLLDNLHIEALQGWDMGRRIREQANLTDA